MLNNSQLNRLTISLSLGMIATVLVGLNSTSFAQSRNDNDGYQSSEKSTLFGDSPSGLDPLELMHRAQQLKGRSAAEFNADSQGELDSSVSDFKRLQQQRILEQQQPISPSETPGTPGNPEG